MAVSDGTMISILIVVAVLVIVGLILIRMSMKIVNHAEVMIVERFGKFHQTLLPGLHFLIPIIDQVRFIDWRYLKTNSNSTYTQVIHTKTDRIDLREHVLEFGRQHVITKDTVQTDIDALVYFRVTDPRLAVFRIENVPVAIELATQATLRNIIASMTLDDTFSSRDEINSLLLARIQPDVERWGVSITRVEIFNIIPPNDIKAAMEQQIKAERQRRSAVLQADGERESRIINSRGDAARLVLYAESFRASTILDAKGQAESRLLLSRAEAEAMKAVRSGVGDSVCRAVDYLTAIQYLNTLRDVTSSSNGRSTDVVLVPVDTLNGISDLVKLNRV